MLHSETTPNAVICQYRNSWKVGQLLSLWWVLLEEQQLQDCVHHPRYQMLQLLSSRIELQRLLSSTQA